MATKKKAAKVKQTLRLTPTQNGLIVKAAKLAGLSVNTWAGLTLTEMAEAIIQNKKRK